jgi:hypothetical protein
MSIHQHMQPLNRRRAPSTNIPANVYGAIVGTLDGPLNNADNNHIGIPVRIATGPSAGRYILQVNTESSQDSGQPADEYFVFDEPIAMADVPAEGFTREASLSYAGMGLHQPEFQVVTNGMLRTIVANSAANADLVSAYGFTFPGGLHDIHYNNGEPAGSHFPNKPNEDGALAFYMLNLAGQTTRRWIFIKFQSQSLP